MPAPESRRHPIACSVDYVPDYQALIERAIALKRAARGDGGEEPPLRGKHLGLICERPDSLDADLFRRAASRLGAHVACIAPVAAGALDAQQVANTARLLGRLYDAVECQGLPAENIAAIRNTAGIPVLEGVACESEVTAHCAAVIDSKTGDRDGRFYLLQAALIDILD
jgi:ornithine carbamoyltransferase